MAGPTRSRSFTTLGIPIDSVGLGRAEAHGTELSPAALRRAGLGRLGWADAGDLAVRIPDHDRDPATGLVGLAGVLDTTSAIRRRVTELCRAGDRPFLLGGCCTLAAGALAGARDALGSGGLIYVDGHLDFYDGRSSPTGEAADMPVAVILGDGPAPWVERVAPAPVCRADQVAILGYRDEAELDDLADELAANRARGLLAVDADGIRRDGPRAAATAALEHVGRTTDRLWLHVDLDVLDEAVFPATDYLLPGGLDWEALVDLLGPIAASPSLVGWSLGCYNPEKDPDGEAGRAIVAVLERIFPA